MLFIANDQICKKIFQNCILKILEKFPKEAVLFCEVLEHWKGSHENAWCSLKIVDIIFIATILQRYRISCDFLTKCTSLQRMYPQNVQSSITSEQH